MPLPTAKEKTPCTCTWIGTTHPPRLETHTVATSLLSLPQGIMKPLSSLKHEKPQVFSFELLPLISFFTEKLKWVTDKGSISSFLIHLKEAGSATKLFCSEDLFVFSVCSKASKCGASITGAVFSGLSITILMAASLRILLSFVNIHEAHLLRGHYQTLLKCLEKISLCDVDLLCEAAVLHPQPWVPFL